jgi:hypothetical protein
MAGPHPLRVSQELEGLLLLALGLVLIVTGLALVLDVVSLRGGLNWLGLRNAAATVSAVHDAVPHWLTQLVEALLVPAGTYLAAVGQRKRQAGLQPR